MKLRGYFRRMIGVTGTLCAVAAICVAAPMAAADEAAAAQAELNAARTDSIRAEARLSLATARAAVLDRRWDVAESEGQRALSALRSLPAGDGVTDQALMAEGIIARARSGRAAAAAAPAPAAATPPRVGGVTQMTPVSPRTPVSGASPARAGTPASNRPESPVRADDVDAGATPVPFRDQAAQRDAINDDEVRLLNDVDAARRVPLDSDQWVSYPSDWPQKAARRSREYPGGLVARSDGWTDAQGREWYMGVYDVSDLIYVVPDFAPQVQLNPVVAFRTWQDRFALNFNLAGFGNFAFDDPERYLLLSRYFGGIDDLMWRGPKYSVERQQQLQQMVELLVGEQGQQARVIAVPPVQPPP